MKVTGTKITKTQETVDINPSKFINELFENWKRNNAPPGADYINEKGEWENWEATHGSGHTTTYRMATDYEVSVVNAFLLFDKIACGIKE